MLIFLCVPLGFPCLLLKDSLTQAPVTVSGPPTEPQNLVLLLGRAENPLLASVGQRTGSHPVSGLFSFQRNRRRASTLFTSESHSLTLLHVFVTELEFLAFCHSQLRVVGSFLVVMGRTLSYFLVTEIQYLTPTTQSKKA